VRALWLTSASYHSTCRSRREPEQDLMTTTLAWSCAVVIAEGKRVPRSFPVRTCTWAMSCTAGGTSSGPSTGLAIASR
jgi:hypothetical protein